MNRPRALYYLRLGCSNIKRSASTNHFCHKSKSASISKQFATLHLKQGLDGARQQAAGIVKYIWRSVGDDRVRPSHALNEGKIFTRGDDEDPGEAFGCRCSAEPILEDAGKPIIQANPLGWAAAIAAAIARRAAILRRAGTRRAERAAEEAAKPKPTPPKPAEAPKPSPTGKNSPPGGRTNTEWKLGKHKSDAKWENQMRERGWTKEKITDTIKNWKEYKAPNDVRRNDPTATATRYEKDGKFVVRDDQTGEILQVGGEKFIPKDLP